MKITLRGRKFLAMLKTLDYFNVQENRQSCVINLLHLHLLWQEEGAMWDLSDLRVEALIRMLNYFEKQLHQYTKSGMISNHTRSHLCLCEYQKFPKFPKRQ